MTSADQWWKARKAIRNGMIGKMITSQGSYHRNRNGRTTLFHDVVVPLNLVRGDGESPCRSRAVVPRPPRN